MADSTSLQIKSKTVEDSSSTLSITNINPNATNAKMLEFAQRLNLLTNHVYDSTTKIERTNLDTSGPGTQKQTSTLSLSATSASKTTIQDANETGEKYSCIVATITYDGDGTVYAYGDMTNRWATTVFKSGNVLQLRILASYFAYHDNPTTNTPAPATITVTATETDNYFAPTPVTFTITA